MRNDNQILLVTFLWNFSYFLKFINSLGKNFNIELLVHMNSFDQIFRISYCHPVILSDRKFGG